MVARGELGFVMAREAHEEDILSTKPFVACIWALFLCTFLPPFAFGWALRKRDEEEARNKAAAGGDTNGASDAR